MLNYVGLFGFWKGQWLHEGAATIKVIHVTLQYILRASDLILFLVFRELESDCSRALGSEVCALQ